MRPGSDHLNLIERIAHRLRQRLPCSVEIGDLINDGFIGLAAARKGFDAARGVPFTAFARKWIRGAMLDGLRARDWLPRGIRSAAAPAPRILPFLECATQQRHADSLAMDRDWLGQIIAALPRRRRLLVQLHYFEELSLQQVAQCLGVTAACISQVHQRILAAFRADQARAEKDPAGGELSRGL